MILTRRIAVIAMVTSFVVLGAIDIYEGRTRLGAAGLLLAAVQTLIFTGGAE